jgi:hypothetical protein
MYRFDVCAALPGLVALVQERLARLGRTLSPAERSQFLR